MNASYIQYAQNASAFKGFPAQYRQDFGGVSLGVGRKLGSKSGRPPVFDAQASKERNTVERCFSKLRQFRAAATREQLSNPVYR
ncbi:hypothetical protein ABT120_30235 [Nonomuraea angiospora]|uniref:hypothetical protein n=1 Tax=Nonomuraea angiospora TaxID=46172 RepID=UPI00332EE94C